LLANTHGNALLITFTTTSTVILNPEIHLQDG
jgi:hypothetical protein